MLRILFLWDFNPVLQTIGFIKPIIVPFNELDFAQLLLQKWPCF